WAPRVGGRLCRTGAFASCPHLFLRQLPCYSPTIPSLPLPPLPITRMVRGNSGCPSIAILSARQKPPACCPPYGTGASPSRLPSAARVGPCELGLFLTGGSDALLIGNGFRLPPRPRSCHIGSRRGLRQHHSVLDRGRRRS